MGKLRDTIIAGNLNISGEIKTVDDWITPSMGNSWVNYDTNFNQVGYFKDKSGIVYLRGLIKNGTFGGSTVIFTLPVGYRPIKRCLFMRISDSVLGRCDIANNGAVIAYSGDNSWFSLEGISFRAEL